MANGKGTLDYLVDENKYKAQLDALKKRQDDFEAAKLMREMRQVGGQAWRSEAKPGFIRAKPADETPENKE